MAKIEIIGMAGIAAHIPHLIDMHLKHDVEIIEQEKRANNNVFTNNIPFTIRPRDIEILTAATIYDPFRKSERKTNMMKPKPKRKKNKKR